MVSSADWRDTAKVAELLKSAATIAYSGTAFDECLKAALDLVCSFTGWPLGHAYLLEEKSAEEGERRLFPTTIWHIDQPDRFERFVETTEVTTFSGGTGLPGRVLDTGEPVWVADVREDPNFPRWVAAAQCGISAGLAFPIVTSRGTEGVLEFFSPADADPDAVLLDLLVHVGRQIGTVLDATRAQQAIAMR